MPRLSFRKEFVAPIQEGRKVSTIRKYTRLEVGDYVDLMNSWSQPPFARARVTEVREVGLFDLTEQDARDDGFSDVRELQGVLARLYPGVDRFVKIAFCVSEPKGAM